MSDQLSAMTRYRLQRAAEKVTEAQQAETQARINLGREILSAISGGASLRQIAPVLALSHERVRQLANIAKPKPD